MNKALAIPAILFVAILMLLAVLTIWCTFLALIRAYCETSSQKHGLSCLLATIVILTVLYLVAICPLLMKEIQDILTEVLLR